MGIFGHIKLLSRAAALAMAWASLIFPISAPSAYAGQRSIGSIESYDEGAQEASRQEQAKVKELLEQSNKSTPFMVKRADLDDDGREEFIACANTGPREFIYFILSSDAQRLLGEFDFEQARGSGKIPVVRIADLNQDGCRDVVLDSEGEKRFAAAYLIDKRVVSGSPAGAGTGELGRLESYVLDEADLPKGAFMARDSKLLDLYSLNNNPIANHYAGKQPAAKESAFALYWSSHSSISLLVLKASSADLNKLIEKQKSNSSIAFSEGNVASFVRYLDMQARGDRKQASESGVVFKDLNEVINFDYDTMAFADFLAAYRKKTGMNEVWKSPGTAELEDMAEMVRGVAHDGNIGYGVYIKIVDFPDRTKRAVMCCGKESGSEIVVSLVKEDRGEYKIAEQFTENIRRADGIALNFEADEFRFTCYKNGKGEEKSFKPW